MKAQELRIRNLIKYIGYPQPVTVKRISQYGVIPGRDLNGMEDEEWELEAFEGITLTEEWLLRLGWVVSNNDIETWYKPQWIINKDADGNFFTVKGEKVVLKYVHTLQNLYYAFTGEELTIKETAK